MYSHLLWISYFIPLQVSFVIHLVRYLCTAPIFHWAIQTMYFCRLQLWWNRDENWYWSFKVLTFDILLFQWSFVRDSLYLIIYILFKRMRLFLILLNRITKVKHHFVFCGYVATMVRCLALSCNVLKWPCLESLSCAHSHVTEFLTGAFHISL